MNGEEEGEEKDSRGPEEGRRRSVPSSLVLFCICPWIYSL